MIAVVAAFFMCIFFLLLGLFHLFFGERLKVAKRVSAVAGNSTLSLREQELKIPFGQRVIRPVLKKLAGPAGACIPAGRFTVLEEKLDRAGRPGGLRAGEYAVLRYFFACLAGGFLYVLAKAVCLSPAQVGFLLLVGVLLGWRLPDFYLHARIQDRAASICRELPDVLDLLTVSVEAGLGFDGALLRVAKEKKGLLAKEFVQALREINMGRPRREALRATAERLGVEEFSAFIGSVVVADRLGISIANVLRAQAGQMRTKRRQRAEEKAMKAPVKMLLPMVFFIFPALFIVLLGPAVLKILQVFAK